MQPVSLAIPHFERYVLVLESFAQVFEDPRITEIVICDDASEDGSFQLLRSHFRNHPKVKLFRNETNLDCYRNKCQALQHATNKWCLLLDSDNVIGRSFIDTLYNLGEWDENFFYCPDFAWPHFNFTAFAGQDVSKANVADMMKRQHFATMLNAANYLVPREGYIRVWDPEVNPHTADSIYMAYRWLAHGGRMKVVPGLKYFHRVHDGSHYKKNHHKTGGFTGLVENRLKQMKGGE